METFQDKMDQLLQMIQSADPSDNQEDSVELLQLEGKFRIEGKWMNVHKNERKLISDALK